MCHEIIIDKCLEITFKASENRMQVTSSYIRHENKAILITSVQVKLLKNVAIEVLQNARHLSEKYHGWLMPLENSRICYTYIEQYP